MLLYRGYLIVISYSKVSDCLSFLLTPLFPYRSQRVQQQIHNYPHSGLLVNVKLRCGGTFPPPWAIGSSNKKAAARVHSLAHCWDQVFWQKLLGAAIEDLSSQNPECPPTGPYPRPSSLPPVDTCSLWHPDWLPHCQWSRGPWLMCNMRCLAASLWTRDDKLKKTTADLCSQLFLTV